MILQALTDEQMLKFMGRENGEDYSADFLVMLNTWEGAVKFLNARAETKVSNRRKPIEIARLLGWTAKDGNGEQMNHTARA